MIHKSIYFISYFLILISYIEYEAGKYMFYLSSKTINESALNHPFTRDSPRYPFWKNTGKSPISMDFYFFNWTNPEEINIEGKKPTFVEVGPYSFQVRKRKVEIDFHPRKNKVSYRHVQTWFFQQNQSVGTLQDKITQLDVVAVSAIHRSRYSSRDVQNLFYTIGLESNFSITKTINQLLFTGYVDKLQDLQLIPEARKFKPSDPFGWYHARNGSTAYDGYFSMDIGSSNISCLGLLTQWNFLNKTDFYKRPCNLIEGGGGDFWPPNQTEDDIKLFTPDLCRPITYEFNKRINYMNIKGYQYILGEKTLGRITKKKGYYSYDMKEDLKKGNSTKVDKNLKMGRCYCNGECNPSGLINITSCYSGYPVFVSLPHFYKADPIVSNQVVGMKPSEDDHNYQVTLDPATGIILEFSSRLQFNMLLPSLQGNLPLEGVPQIYFPILWYTIEYKVPDKILSALRVLHNTVYKYELIGYIFYSLSALGLAIINAFIIYFLIKYIRNCFREEVTPEIPLVEVNRGGNSQN